VEITALTNLPALQPSSIRREIASLLKLARKSGIRPQVFVPSPKNAR
jgi:hypothetical protein